MSQRKREARERDRSEDARVGMGRRVRSGEREEGGGYRGRGLLEGTSFSLTSSGARVAQTLCSTVPSAPHPPPPQTREALVFAGVFSSPNLRASVES